MAGARVDHGAQFFTVRSDRFRSLVEPHIDSGLVFEWCRGFDQPPDGFARFAVRGGMNALAKSLAAALDVRCESMVFAIRRNANHTWSVALDDGSVVAADAVVVTCPLPQSYSLLVTAEIDLPADLMRSDYDRTVAALVTLDQASNVAEPGGAQHPTARLSFVADNQRKGISDVPALTLHANATWSMDLWDLANADIISAFVDEASELIGLAAIAEVQLKKWRFATPRIIWPDPCWVAPDGVGLVLAGDAFAGPKVEGAVLSGDAAAAAFDG